MPRFSCCLRPPGLPGLWKSEGQSQGAGGRTGGISSGGAGFIGGWVAPRRSASGTWRSTRPRGVRRPIDVLGALPSAAWAPRFFAPRALAHVGGFKCRFGRSACPHAHTALQQCTRPLPPSPESKPPPGKYIIDPRTMGALQKHAVVLHPLPRVDEVGARFLLACWFHVLSLGWLLQTQGERK